MAKPEPEPIYFEDTASFMGWLEDHHASDPELWVGFHKRATGRPSLTWPQSVDAALCYGWIDGIRKTIDGDRYKIRFTPRRPRSIWSAVNLKRVPELIELGLMQPAGLRTYEARDPSRAGLYSFENRPQELPDEYERTFRQNPTAWKFFEAQPPGYRRTTIFWVLSAKREDTRAKRLQSLIEDSAARRRVGLLA